jgi:hypothetical protein
MSSASGLGLLALCILLFVAFWCAVLVLISALIGWRALAARFRSDSAPCGDLRTAGPWFATVYMRGWTHYSGVIRMTAAGDALYLSVLMPFRVGHPPLRIPWDEIAFTRTRRFLQNFVALTLGTQERIPFRISERTARKLGLAARIAPENPASALIAD